MSNMITLLLLGVAAYVLLFRTDTPRKLVKGTRVSMRDATEIGELMDVDFARVDPEEFRMGLQEEEEHEDITGGDWETTAKIALAHLDEDPAYYSKLKRTLG